MKLIVLLVAVIIFIGGSVKITIDRLFPVYHGWKVYSIDLFGRGADGIRMLDVNGNGFKDIAVGWEESGETRIYFHPGPDNVTWFWPSAVIGDTGGVEDAFFVDLDADGFVDVVSSSEDGNIYVHWAPSDPEAYLNGENWVTEPFPQTKGRDRWMIADAAQIDGRHGVDLLIGGKSDSLYWLAAPASPRNLADWTMHRISNMGGWTMGLKAVDLNRDGHIDLVVGIRNQNPGLKWFENPGPDRVSADDWISHEIGSPTSTGFIEVIDLDGDGRLDVLAPVMEGDNAVRFMRGLNDAATEWQEIRIEVPEGRNKGVAAGDVTLDGTLDIVMSQESADIYLLTQGEEGPTGRWSVTKIASGKKYDDVTLYDVDKDGDLDILTTDERGLQVLWFRNPAIR